MSRYQPYNARETTRRMVDTLLHSTSIPFAIVTGTSAVVVAFLSWEALRQSLIGRLVALLPLSMALATGYHVAALVGRPASVPLEAIQSAVYTAIALLALSLVLTHRRIRRDATGR